MGPDGLLVSHRTSSHSAGIHVPFTNCFVCRLFYVVHDLKPPLHSHNWLRFPNSKTQNAFLFTVNAIFLHDKPLAVEPVSTPSPLVQKMRRDSLPIDMLLSAVSVLVVAQSSSEIPERLMNNPVLQRVGYVGADISSVASSISASRRRQSLQFLNAG